MRDISCAVVDACLTVDVAASHIYDGGLYQLGDESRDSEAMSAGLARPLPIVSIEDISAQDD